MKIIVIIVAQGKPKNNFCISPPVGRRWHVNEPSFPRIVKTTKVKFRNLSFHRLQRPTVAIQNQTWRNLRTKKSIQKAYFKPDNFYPFSLHITVSATLCLKDSRQDFLLKLSTFIIDPIWCYLWRYRHNWLTVNEGNLWLLPPNIGTSADIEASSIDCNFQAYVTATMCFLSQRNLQASATDEDTREWPTFRIPRLILEASSKLSTVFGPENAWLHFLVQLVQPSWSLVTLIYMVSGGLRSCETSHEYIQHKVTEQIRLLQPPFLAGWRSPNLDRPTIKFVKLAERLKLSWWQPLVLVEFFF